MKTQIDSYIIIISNDSLLIICILLINGINIPKSSKNNEILITKTKKKPCIFFIHNMIK